LLCRSSLLKHPSGITVKTPLLVPSFSSKGFAFHRKGKSEVSEIRDIFKNTAEVLTEAMLVSAYDIFYKHLPSPQKFPCTPLITFVDSGGYEAGDDYDFSATYRYKHHVDEWDLTKYQQVLKSWPDRVTAVFVNYDKGTVRKSVKKQICEARRLFSQYPNQLHNFLLKPTHFCKGQVINTIRNSQPIMKEFGTFHIIGVTEKELGPSMLDRMEAVATLRRNLDFAGVSAPIQVFGALDPLSSSLYLLAGAEIFDGLTWLRFAYWERKCIYSHNHGVLHSGIDMHHDFIQSKMLSDNYNELRQIQLAFRDFVNTKDFHKLSPYSDFLHNAVDSLKNRLGG